MKYKKDIYICPETTIGLTFTSSPNPITLNEAIRIWNLDPEPPVFLINKELFIAVGGVSSVVELVSQFRAFPTYIMQNLNIEYKELRNILCQILLQARKVMHPMLLAKHPPPQFGMGVIIDEWNFENK